MKSNAGQRGGKFGHAFTAAVVSEMAGAWIDGIGEGKKEYAGVRIIAAAVVGGTTSMITGGKFANGAMTAAFARAYNSEGGHDDSKQVIFRKVRPHNGEIVKKMARVLQMVALVPRVDIVFITVNLGPIWGLTLRARSAIQSLLQQMEK